MIHHTDLKAFIKDGVPAFKKGPVALIFAEDEVELDTTIRHHLALGFKHTVVFAMPEFTIAQDVEDDIIRVNYNMLIDAALETAVNAVMKAAGDIWIYYCFNSEFLFFPFCEHRTVGEMIAFNVEERRDTILSYVVDLYTGDLWVNTNAVCIEDAHLDKTGYYALARKRPLEQRSGSPARFLWRIAVAVRRTHPRSAAPHRPRIYFPQQIGTGLLPGSYL